MNITPKVTIILTSYNHGKYLRESIESVLRQTFADFKLIIWDDASTDESWKIIQSYTDSRIEAFRNETNKRGVINTVLFSYKNLSDYIAIHHSDDLWEPQKLEKQVAFLESNPHVGAVFTWAYIIDENGNPLEDETHFYYKVFEQKNRSRYEWLNYFFYTGNALCHPSVVIRKSCYENCGSYRYGFSQLTDFDMWVRLCLKYDIYVWPEKLVRFRVRENDLNVSGNRPSTRIRSQFEYLQILHNYLALDNPNDFINVFPDSAKFFKQEKYDIGFAMAMSALESKYNFSKLFGLRQLWEILNDENRAKKVKEIYGFSTKNFIELTAKHDVFSIIRLEDLSAQLEVQNLSSVTIAEQEKIILQKEREVQGLAAQVNEIMSSNLWRYFQRLVKIREALLPYGSRRERLFYLPAKVFLVLKNEGWRAVLRAAHRKLFAKGLAGEMQAAVMKSANPIVSIVIPVFNAAHLTQKCIEQVYLNTAHPSFEIIVVDNHSTDDTERILDNLKKKHANLRTYRMPENLGFAGAVNYGCGVSEGEYIVILNNDTLVTQGWLEKLLAPFQEDALIGIVSPVTNYVGEGPQLDPQAVELRPEQIEAYASEIEERGYIYESSRLVFFCVAIKREVLDIIGGLDTGYVKGNFEDDDYCMRAITTGFRLAIARNSFVYHFGSMTFKDNKISHAEFMEKNRKRFYAKAQNVSMTLRPPVAYKPNVMVSVVVRTMNRIQLLQRALTSLSNQTFREFEVVVVNDGGQDVSDVLAQFENYFPIRHVYNLESQGRTRALNSGIERSTGEWITFLDDDDIIYPWHLDAFVKVAQQNRDVLFFYGNCNRSLFATTKDKYPILTVGSPPWEYDPRSLLIRNYLPIHTWFVSRKCFERIGVFDTSQAMLEDYEFLVRLSREYQFVHVPKVTCEYRYYLDGVNSMITNRPATLAALKYIYDTHPVDDARIILERKLQLMALEEQIQEIKRLYSLLEDKLEDESVVYRKIVGLVAGL
jgi:GT2 family glycosyltransferase